MQGDATPDDPDASQPFARGRQRIQHAVAEGEFAFRMERVISLDVARLIPSRRNLRMILRPIFQLMRFYLQETPHYTHLLCCFQPTVFPQILGSFARVFELALRARCSVGSGRRGLRGWALHCRRAWRLSTVGPLVFHEVVEGARELGARASQDDGAPEEAAGLTLIRSCLTSVRARAVST